jgi:hypothetical protein
MNGAPGRRFQAEARKIEPITFTLKKNEHFVLKEIFF